MFPRYILTMAFRHSLCVVFACTLLHLAWQSASAQRVRQGETASFTFSETQGPCTRVTGYGAHFPPGSTVTVAGPQVNGRNVGDYVQIERQVAPDGTFTVTLQPCPQQLVSPAGTFPLSDGVQFTFTADTRAQNGVGSSATYTVSGLENSRLPHTGVPGGTMPDILLVQLVHVPLLALVLIAGALALLGVRLSRFERARPPRP